MKKLILTPFLLLAILFINQGCDDDDDNSTDNTYSINFSKSDAEEIIANSISYSTYGLVASMNQVSQEIDEITECDIEYVNEDTKYGESVPGYISYTYNYTEEYKKTCAESSTIQYSLTGEQIFDAPRVEYNHDLSVDFTIEGLDDSYDDELYTGKYSRQGDGESGVSSENYNFKFSTEIENAVYVSKETNKIYAGILNFSLEQEYEESNVTYSYSGTIEFVDENEALVTFDNGDSFNVTLDNISISEEE